MFWDEFKILKIKELKLNFKNKKGYFGHFIFEMLFLWQKIKKVCLRRLTKYLSLTYKLVWLEYLDRESTDIFKYCFLCSEFCLVILDIYFVLFVYIFKYSNISNNFKSSYIFNIFVYIKSKNI